jgi:hypothetical protein
MLNYYFYHIHLHFQTLFRLGLLPRRDRGGARCPVRYLHREKLYEIDVAARLSLRQHRLKTCATKDAGKKVIPDMITGLLVPKLPLGNPLGSKALLCRAY